MPGQGMSQLVLGPRDALLLTSWPTSTQHTTASNTHSASVHLCTHSRKQVSCQCDSIVRQQQCLRPSAGWAASRTGHRALRHSRLCPLASKAAPAHLPNTPWTTAQQTLATPPCRQCLHTCVNSGQQHSLQPQPAALHELCCQHSFTLQNGAAGACWLLFALSKLQCQVRPVCDSSGCSTGGGSEISL